MKSRTNKQSWTNSCLSIRLQEAGLGHRHPYQTLQIPYKGKVTWRVQAANQEALLPLAQWVTSGEDWSYGRQPRQKIRQGAMPQGRSRPSSSKRPDTYPTPAWQVAGGTNSPMSFPQNGGQSSPCSFRVQQRLGRQLASRTSKW